MDEDIKRLQSDGSEVVNSDADSGRAKRKISRHTQLVQRSVSKNRWCFSVDCLRVIYWSNTPTIAARSDFSISAHGTVVRNGTDVSRLEGRGTPEDSRFCKSWADRSRHSYGGEH